MLRRCGLRAVTISRGRTVALGIFQLLCADGAATALAGSIPTAVERDRHLLRVLLQQAAELQAHPPAYDFLQGRELHPGCRRPTHRGTSDRTNPCMACAMSAIARSQAYLAVVADVEDRHGHRPHPSCTGSVRSAPQPVSGGSLHTRPVDGVRHAIRFAAGCSGSLHFRLEHSCIVVPDPPKLAAQLPNGPLMGSIRRRRQYSRISRPGHGWLAGRPGFWAGWQAGLLGCLPAAGRIGSG